MSNTMFNRFAEFPRHHVSITPNDSADLSREMLIYAATAGAIAVHDMDGTAITYTVQIGDILPIIAKRVLSTGTTATVVGLY